MEVKSQWTIFHQKEELTTRVHNILEEYPSGIGPFKEFVQNADDAGARCFGVVLDEQSYGTNSLLSAGLGEWQVGVSVFSTYSQGTISFGVQ